MLVKNEHHTHTQMMYAAKEKVGDAVGADEQVVLDGHVERWLRVGLVEDSRSTSDMKEHAHGYSAVVLAKARLLPGCQAVGDGCG